MNFAFQTRQADSPFVDMIWCTQSEHAGSFISRAASNWEIVITRLQGTTSITLRGPETRAWLAPCPADAEFFGIVFKLGTYMPQLPAATLVDNALTLPAISSTRFSFQGVAWHYPNFEHADSFVARLVRTHLLAHDPVVAAVLQGERQHLSPRSIQYHFVRATGLSHSTISQIERARKAASLLEQGVSITDTVFDAGYADQSHLTRSLKRLAGSTPAQIGGSAAA